MKMKTYKQCNDALKRVTKLLGEYHLFSGFIPNSRYEHITKSLLITIRDEFDSFYPVDEKDFDPIHTAKVTKGEDGSELYSNYLLMPILAFDKYKNKISDDEMGEGVPFVFNQTEINALYRVIQGDLNSIICCMSDSVSDGYGYEFDTEHINKVFDKNITSQRCSSAITLAILEFDSILSKVHPGGKFDYEKDYTEEELKSLCRLHEQLYMAISLIWDLKQTEV